VAGDLGDEIADQARVEQELPRLARMPAGREELGRDLPLDELDRVLGRGLDRLADPELIDQPGDDRALRPVDPRFDARVVAHGDVGRLNGGESVPAGGSGGSLPRVSTAEFGD